MPMLNGNESLDIAKRCQIRAALLKGNSINATCRMLGVRKRTVQRLLKMQDAPVLHHDAMARSLEYSASRINEIWAFVR